MPKFTVLFKRSRKTNLTFTIMQYFLPFSSSSVVGSTIEQFRIATNAFGDLMCCSFWMLGIFLQANENIVSANSTQSTLN